ncbi:MAG TPA: SGNH/GDSL hydrolase family protein [Pyrinomonadaceae bacterium]|nr:SGNH/GDSL hydrolase family protein [Pyrinomonadaceae bacterium]
MYHVVLLGDSVFDNAAYVAPGEPDVLAQVRARLPENSEATLLAVDGSRLAGVARQLERVPAGATHLVLSCGGNDALGHAGLLEERASSVAECLDKLARAGRQFERDYSEAVASLTARRLPAVLCTIYYPQFADEDVQRLAVTALSVFNDCITRAAFAAGLPLIDLRLVCDDPLDYANPIEPSARGGDKIARAITRAVMEHDFASRRTSVFFQQAPRAGQH